MDYFYAFCVLFGGIGTFLLGFKILSNNMEKLSTNALRNWFSKTSSNPFAGVGIGIVSSALMHSSAVTTIMTIGLVNAGIMSLFQATTVIMGANIGTTITAQIVALGSFNFTDVAMVLAVVGVFMVMLSKKEKVKIWGYIIASLGLIFAGLKLTSIAVDDIKQNPAVVNILQSVTNPILLLLIGAVLTGIMQSSTAITSIIIVTAQSGLVIGGGGNAVLFLIMGSNIGTCVTAIISGIGANVNAKRTSLIHLIFNLTGSLIFTIILLIWKNFMNDTLAKWFSEPATQIAMFHTLFNVVCTIILLPLAKVLVKISTFLIKDEKEEKTSVTDYLDERFLKLPGIALGAVLSETKHMANLSMSALSLAFDGFMNKNVENQQKIEDLVQKTYQLNGAITQYTVKVSAKNLSIKDENVITSVHGVLSDIERLSELSENIIRYAHHYIDNELVFSEGVKEELYNMFGKTSQLFQEAMGVFDLNPRYNTQVADQLEAQIDDCRKNLIDEHMLRLKEGACRPESSGVFINLVNNLERAGDHLNFIAHAFDPNFRR